MTEPKRLLPLAAGVASLILGVVCVVTDTAILGVAAGVCGGLASLLALYALGDADRNDERLATSKQQVEDLEDVVADQVRARISAEEAVASLGDQLSESEATPKGPPARRDVTTDGAILDNETGLFNEHYFSVSVHTRVAAARRHLRPVSVVLLDLVESLETDRESAVDPKAVTESIRATLRDSDTACRLADGRFALLLEDTPENGAIWTIERIRRHLASHYDQVTMWAGVACYPAHAFDRDRLVEQANIALSSAKDWRQDRIEVATAD